MDDLTLLEVYDALNPFEWKKGPDILEDIAQQRHIDFQELYPRGGQLGILYVHLYRLEKSGYVGGRCCGPEDSRYGARIREYKMTDDGFLNRDMILKAIARLQEAKPNRLERMLSFFRKYRS